MKLNYSDFQSINNLLKQNENEYITNITKKYGSKYMEQKTSDMDSLLRQLDNKKVLSKSDIKKIRQFALSKGGFLYSSYRKEFYKRVLYIDNDNIDFIYYENSTFETKRVKDNQTEIKTNCDYIIEVDCKRSMVNNLFDRDKHQNSINAIKEDLEKVIKKYITMSGSKYNYYQGFHDIGLYFYLLYFNHEHLQIQVLQRVSEFFFKDYLVEFKNNIKNRGHFEFETVYRVVNSFIENSDRKLYNFIKSNTEYPDPLFALPWVLTSLTHDLKDINTTYRILDYILLSHPSAIFQLVSNVYDY